MLAQFQEHPEAWQRVPAILQQSSSAQTKVSGSGRARSRERGSTRAGAATRPAVPYKAWSGSASPKRTDGLMLPSVPLSERCADCRCLQYIALQILDKLITTRWKVLPVDQQQGIRNFIVETIISVSSDEAALRTQKTYINKLDVTLVQVRAAVG